MAAKKRIAVIFGGQSSEHEVSRVSAESVIRNIDSDKFDVVMIGITKNGRWLAYDGPVEKLKDGQWQAIAEKKALAGLQEATSDIGEYSNMHQDNAHMPSNNSDVISKECGMHMILTGNSARDILKGTGTGTGTGVNGGSIDVVFPVLHGANGEDGTIQGLLELAGVPYVGSGVLGSALCMDKAYTKIIFEREGIPQGKYLVFNRKQIKQDVDSLVKQTEDLLTYPCFVKPSNAGSSVGVTKAHNREELIEGLFHAARYDRRILVEEFIDGREIECSVLGNDDPIASAVGEVIPCNEFYDYSAKYDAESDSEIIIPADLPEETISEIRQYALKAFEATDCAGLSRVDFFVHKETGRVYINEINTMPGFTSISMYAKLWEASGIPYNKLVEKLIELAEERFEDNRREI